jgi:hypothetical protein
MTPDVAAPAASSDVVSRTIAGETLLVPVKKRVAAFDRIYVLNKVAAFLWTQLDGRRTRAELEALVRSRFAVPAERDLQGDVERFLGELVQRGLAAPAAPAVP